MTEAKHPRAHAVRSSRQVHYRQMLDVYTHDETGEPPVDTRSSRALVIGIDSIRNTVMVEINDLPILFARRETDLLQDRGGAYLTKRDALDGPQVGPTE